MKILYYLAGIGSPNYDVKKHILIDNLNLLSRQGEVDLITNIYDETILHDLTITLLNLKCIGKYYNHVKKGVLSQLWLSNPYNTIIKNYDCVLFCLDDVRIIDLNIRDMLEKKRDHNMHIISPKIENSMHTWLMTNDDTVYNFYVTSGLEIFLLLFEPTDFNKFLEVQDIENPWLWGLDFLLGHLGFNCGVYHEYKAYHLFRATNGDSALTDAGENMLKYIKKHGFETFNDIVNSRHMVQHRFIVPKKD